MWAEENGTATAALLGERRGAAARIGLFGRPAGRLGAAATAVSRNSPLRMSDLTTALAAAACAAFNFNRPCNPRLKWQHSGVR
jgi:hypothetical protein